MDGSYWRTKPEFYTAKQLVIVRQMQAQLLSQTAQLGLHLTYHDQLLGSIKFRLVREQLPSVSGLRLLDHMHVLHTHIRWFCRALRCHVPGDPSASGEKEAANNRQHEDTNNNTHPDKFIPSHSQAHMSAGMQNISDIGHIIDHPLHTALLWGNRTYRNF